MSQEIIDAENHAFVVPSKGVMTPSDMENWKRSEAYQEYNGFLSAMNEAIKGKAISGDHPSTPAVDAAIGLLERLDGWIDEFPPVTSSQRFGNQAFRSWFDHLKQESEIILKEMLPVKLHRAIPEIGVYLVEGFGNSTRIDYGTGHEMCFLWFLSCLFKIGFFDLTDKCAVALTVFGRYMRLVRKLQITYRMEPAGSHGVWSLDDFQFVPFIWGSAQLIGHPRIEPKSFLQENIVETYHKDYLFLACIRYINQVKTGPFFEHSNQLYNVSGVSDWTRVNQGLKRKYEDEVLSKFPLVQHVLFGSLMPFTPSSRPPTDMRPSTHVRPTRRLPPKADISQLPPPAL